jgi:predicted alpha/beta-hydrolase family hydrolase
MPTSAPSLRFDGPEHARDRVALAHGAGAGMDEPMLATVAAGLAARGIRVARFEFPYMAKRRVDSVRRGPDRAPVLLETWRSAIVALGDPATLVIGGKSMGGRMASRVADEVGARGLVCLGYPFHPPRQPDRVRTAHLAAIQTPTLVVQGTRDPFGTPADVAGYRLAPSIRVHWIDDGDHSLVPRKASGRTKREAWEEAVEAVAAFLLSLARVGGPLDARSVAEKGVRRGAE